MVVFVDEEFGYRLYAWETNFQTEQELAAWWREVQDAEPFGANAKALARLGKGKVIKRVEGPIKGAPTLSVHWNCDSDLRLTSGEVVLHAGHVSTEAYFGEVDEVQEALERAERGETIDPRTLFDASSVQELENWEAVRAAALSEMEE